MNNYFCNNNRRKFMKLFSTSLAGGALMTSVSIDALAKQINNYSDGYSLGLKTLQKIGGENYDGPLKKINEVSPDFAKILVEQAYGEVLSRKNLDLETREAITIASLMALGNYDLPIKYHLNGYLNVGGKPEVMIELCFLAIALLGFPSAIKTTGLIREVLKERNIKIESLPTDTDDGRHQHLIGARNIIANTEHGLDEFDELLNNSPDFARLLVSFAHGEILSRDGLDARTKTLSMISMLATIGNTEAWLRDATFEALRSGVKRDELVETLIQLTVYSGYPSALVAFFQIKKVFDELDSGEINLETIEREIPKIELDDRAKRTKRGKKTLSLTSAEAGDKVISGFSDLAPDIGKHIIEHAYGDIFYRPGIDAKSRELTAIASLASSSTLTSEIPLKVHINAGLTAGLTQEEILEALLNLVPYVGYPKIQKALNLTQSVYEERKH